MADLDNLLGSRISLVSQQDIRYDGILFSINAKESSIVLREGITFPKYELYKLYKKFFLLKSNASVPKNVLQIKQNKLHQHHKLLHMLVSLVMK